MEHFLNTDPTVFDLPGTKDGDPAKRLSGASGGGGAGNSVGKGNPGMSRATSAPPNAAWRVIKVENGNLRVVPPTEKGNSLERSGKGKLPTPGPGTMSLMSMSLPTGVSVESRSTAASNLTTYAMVLPLVDMPALSPAGPYEANSNWNRQYQFYPEIFPGEEEETYTFDLYVNNVDENRSGAWKDVRLRMDEPSATDTTVHFHVLRQDGTSYVDALTVAAGNQTPRYSTIGGTSGVLQLRPALVLMQAQLSRLEIRRLSWTRLILDKWAIWFPVPKGLLESVTL